MLAGAGLVEDTGLGNAKTRVWALPDDEEDGDSLVDEADSVGVSDAEVVGVVAPPVSSPPPPRTR